MLILEHQIRLTKSLKADLGIWDTFLDKYNGYTCCQAAKVDNREVELFTDAAGCKGFGLIIGTKWCTEARFGRTLI